VLPNLVAGAVSEGAAQQAGDMMQDFKTAYLLGVCPRAQFIAMLIGSLASCFVSSAAYRLYSSVYEIGGEKLPAPTAQIWLYMAQLVTGGSLPDGVVVFCWLGALLPLARTIVPQVPHQLNARQGSFTRRTRAKCLYHTGLFLSALKMGIQQTSQDFSALLLICAVPNTLHYGSLFTFTDLCQLCLTCSALVQVARLAAAWPSCPTSFCWRSATCQLTVRAIAW
jgi:hypothetical protein